MKIVGVNMAVFRSSHRYEGKETVASISWHDRNVRMEQAQCETIKRVIILGMEKEIITKCDGCALMALGAVLIPSAPIAVVVIIAGGYVLPPSI
ncbi:hypothetical protein COCNU_scaffold006357G000020 [Cocos nucifera]|nr:hypothetical protein [Cocos nucifera]